MAAIEQRHFSETPLVCVICTDDVRHKLPAPSEPRCCTLTAVLVTPVPLTLDADGSPSSHEQKFTEAPPAHVVPVCAPIRRRRAHTTLPTSPTGATYRGARFYIGKECRCTVPICVSCAETWRRGRPNPSCPRFYQRRRACMVCRVEISIGIKSYSFITGPDRQRYFELYEQHLKTIPCRRVARGGYCPFGSACKYSHVGPADTLVQQHQPSSRQRDSENVTIFRRHFPRFDLPPYEPFTPPTSDSE